MFHLEALAERLPLTSIFQNITFIYHMQRLANVKKIAKFNLPSIFTFISLYHLLKNHQGGHIYQQTENLHTVCVQTAERRRRLQRSIRLARFMFFDVKFGLRHVA